MKSPRRTSDDCSCKWLDNQLERSTELSSERKIINALLTYRTKPWLFLDIERNLENKMCWLSWIKIVQTNTIYVMIRTKPANNVATHRKIQIAWKGQVHDGHQHGHISWQVSMIAFVAQRKAWHNRRCLQIRWQYVMSLYPLRRTTFQTKGTRQFLHGV